MLHPSVIAKIEVGDPDDPDTFHYLCCEEGEMEAFCGAETLKRWSDPMADDGLVCRVCWEIAESSWFCPKHGECIQCLPR